jgi:hypothetical protein
LLHLREAKGTLPLLVKNVMFRKRGRKPVLSPIEKEKVAKYIMGMARYRHPINVTELKIKVAETTNL